MIWSLMQNGFNFRVWPKHGTLQRPGGRHSRFRYVFLCAHNEFSVLGLRGKFASAEEVRNSVKKVVRRRSQRTLKELFPRLRNSDSDADPSVPSSPQLYNLDSDDNLSGPSSLPPVSVSTDVVETVKVPPSASSVQCSSSSSSVQPLSLSDCALSSTPSNSEFQDNSSADVSGDVSEPASPACAMRGWSISAGRYS